MKILNIEYVCTGNGGRSPQAQTEARAEVARRGLQDRINIYSSGTAAKDLNEGQFETVSPESLMPYIETALRSGTFCGRAEEVAEEIFQNRREVVESIRSGDPKANEKLSYLIAYLTADEEAKRNIVLLEKGLVPRGPFHQQTQIRNGVDLILPMKESNAQYVRELYEGIENKPRIIPLCEYAGIEGEMEDPAGGTLQDFRDCNVRITEAVGKSLRRAIEEFGIEQQNGWGIFHGR